MKRTLTALTAVLISLAFSIGLALPAQATTAGDVYNILASHKNTNGQPTPVNDATLKRVAQAYAEELAKKDTGKAPSSTNPFPSVPSGYKGGTQIQGVNSKGDVLSITEGWKARYGSVVLNAGYNYLGTGVAQGASGAVYVVANYAKVSVPVAVPAPAPAPVVKAPVVRTPVVQAPAPAPVAVAPVQAPVAPAPAPAPVAPAPVASKKATPAPVAKPKTTPKPTPKPTPTVKPTPTPSAAPAPTASAVPGIAPEELKKVKLQALEAERTAAEAKQKTAEAKQMARKTLTSGGYGLAGLGFLALLPLPFLRPRKEQAIATATLVIDDSDDDFMIGTRKN